MLKILKKITLIKALLATAFLFFGITACSAQDQPASTGSSGTQPLILAPAGLAAQEQTRLERTYRQAYRHKDMLLSPYVAANGAAAKPGEEDLTKLNEQARLYRYFGIAIDLYKAGRLEEAAEILRYVASKNPEDTYVRNYLSRLERQLKTSEVKWSEDARKDAELLKQDEINNLLQDAIAYYENKSFDTSLVKFSDILALEPDNPTANKYMNLLKAYYLSEVKVEDIARDWEDGVRIRQTTKKAADKLLDESDKIGGKSEQLLNEKDRAAQYAKETLDKEEFARILVDKKASSMLDQTELGSRVEDMVTRAKEEEKKKQLFTLGAGDSVQVSVRDHPELSGTVQIRIKGDIVLPLTNELIPAAGLTLDELTTVITEKMKRYVKQPMVNITITEYKSKLFYVVDESGCAPYPITRANFTLRDALFTSDWGDSRALGRVLVIRPSQLHPVIKKVDAYDIIFRGRLANNIPIENGDVIYVPLTNAAKISKTLTDTFAPVTSLGTSLQNTDATQRAYHRIRSYKEFPK